MLGLFLGSLFLLDNGLVDRAQGIDALVEVLDLNVCGGELLGQAVDGLLLILELLLEVSDGLLH